MQLDAYENHLFDTSRHVEDWASGTEGQLKLQAYNATMPQAIHL